MSGGGYVRSPSCELQRQQLQVRVDIAPTEPREQSVQGPLVWAIDSTAAQTVYFA